MPDTPDKGTDDHDEPTGPSLQETLRRLVKHQAQASLVHTTSPGSADIVGFAHSGVYIVRNQFNARPLKVLEDFGYNESWRVDRHLRLLADTTGDGYLDIVGFGEEGVMVSINRGNNRFDPPKKVTGQFSCSFGSWRVERHPQLMVDLRNTGRADILGFGEVGVLVSLNNGDGTYTTPQVALDSFKSTPAGKWDVAKYPRILVDLNGNGLPDIVGFGEGYVYTALNKGDGTFLPVQQSIQGGFTYQGQWRIDKHPRFLVDLTGDGKPDIIGFGNNHVFVALNDGQGQFSPPQVRINQFTYNEAWRVEKHPRFVVDLTGNKCADILGFGEDGVWVSLNNADGTFRTLPGPHRIWARHWLASRLAPAICC